MLSVDIKVNGGTIAIITLRNVTPAPFSYSNVGEHDYIYELYEPVTGDKKMESVLISGKLQHKIEDGYRKLIVKILNQVERKVKGKKK